MLFNDGNVDYGKHVKATGARKKRRTDDTGMHDSSLHVPFSGVHMHGLRMSPAARRLMGLRLKHLASFVLGMDEEIGVGNSNCLDRTGSWHKEGTGELYLRFLKQERRC